MKRISTAWLGFTALTFATALPAQELALSQDSSPHQMQFISVDKNVNLEVLDWGGQTVG
jgi:hypothetical protein